VRGEACRADHYFDAPFLSALRILGDKLRRAMRGGDLRFIRDAEFVEDVPGSLEGFPIVFRPHQDGDEGFCGGIAHVGFVQRVV